VYPEIDPAAAFAAVRAVESRSAPRYRVLQRCHVRPAGVPGAEGWRGLVFSVSVSGVGVTLPLPVERGAEIEIEACELPDSIPLRARIVHTNRLDFVWLAGCELSRRMTGDELAAWLTAATTTNP
jgi:hypothetical protein